jgi:hypothetical protein
MLCPRRLFRHTEEGEHAAMIRMFEVRRRGRICPCLTQVRHVISLILFFATQRRKNIGLYIATFGKRSADIEASETGLERGI